MALPVVGDVVNDVITELSQVPGIATQLYASGRIRQHVQDAIQLEVNEMWWPIPDVLSEGATYWYQWST